MSSRAIRVLAKFIKFREGLLLYLVANAYLLATIPFSWLYYDVRYYYEWVDVTWSRGLVYARASLAGVGQLVLLFPRGLFYVYVYATKASYPPLPILLFISTHSIASSITSYLPVIRLINKLPIVIAYNLIYFILRKNYGWKAGVLWLVNHFSYLTIYNYHADLFVSLFLLLSFTELFRGGSAVKSGVYAALAGLFKPLALVVAPLPLIVLVKGRKYRDALQFALAGALVGLAVVLPFILVDYRSFLQKSLLFHAERYPQEYSLWALPIYFSNYDVAKVPPITKYAWLPLYLIAVAAICYYFTREGEYSEKVAAKYFSLLLVASFLLNKVGNVNYFAWCLPFLIIYSIYSDLYRKLDFAFTYIFVSALLVIVAPAMTIYSAYVVHGSIFIIEDLSYYSSVDLVAKSIDAHTLQYVLAEYLRANAYWYFMQLYINFNLLYAAYSTIYSGYLLYLLLKIAAEGRGAGA